MTAYRLGAQFVLRMTGFPVDDLRALADAELGAAVDARNRADAEAEQRRRAFLDQLRERGKDARKAREAVERKKPFSGPLPDDLAPALSRYHDDLAAAARRADEAAQVYGAALDRSRSALYAKAREERFREMLLMSSPEFEAHLDKDISAESTRNSGVRQVEATLVAYLQRLTTKNETISFYGPSLWGRVDAEAPVGIDLQLGEEIAERRVFVEAWVCESLAQALSGDPAVKPLLRPQLCDDVLLEPGRARLLDRGREVELDAEAEALARRCDGRTRARDLDAAAALEALAASGVVEWALKLPMTATPFGALRHEIEGWPDGDPSRARWLAHLDEIDRRRGALESAVTREPRRQAMTALREALEATGSTVTQGSKALYASRLPINEDCRRGATRAVLGAPFVEQATGDLAPWYELWRDLAGLYATRLHEAIAPIWRSFGGGPVRLATLIQACKKANVTLHKAGGTGAVPQVDAEIQAAWREQLGDRAGLAEVALTDDDLAFVRRRFSFRRMKSFDMPAPDFQVAAASPEALARGDWRLVLGEIHPDFVHWQNVFFMWCPDAAGFTDEYRRGPHGPMLMYGRHLTQTSAHMALRTAEHAGDWSSTGGLPMAHAPYTRSAELWTELTDDDVLVRHPDGRVLGSLVHNWAVALNTHQLELIGEHTHTPRLTVGRAVVQRESWFLQVSDELRQAVEHPTPEAFAALRRFRAERGLPEEVFVWPQLPTRLTLYKDAKPTFVDFRSPLLLEMLGKSVRKYSRLRVVEMLPSTSQCWLEDARGRYSCELRLVTLPK